MGEAMIKLKGEIENAKSKFLKIIGEYLLSEMEKDECLEKCYIEKKRELVNVCEYIKNQAQKEAVSGAAVIDNETVYSWAKHYCLDEPIEEPKKENAKEKVKVAVSKPRKKKIEDKADWNLLGLEL